MRTLFTILLLIATCCCRAQQLSAHDMLTIIQCPDTGCISRELLSKTKVPEYGEGFAFRVDEKGIFLNYVIDDSEAATRILADYQAQGFKNSKSTAEYRSPKYPGIVLRLHEEKAGQFPIYDFELWRSIWEDK
jgi:hypothetical protein